MCGIVGLSAHSPINQGLFDALTVLQHRGQDAAGIVTSDNLRFSLRKSNGLVKDVFRTRHMQTLVGNMGIGHIRYPTAGSSNSAEAQPFYVNSPYGIALAHNGNLTNVEAIKEDLYRSDLRHINTHSDSEVLLNVFAHALQQQGKFKPEPEDVFDAVRHVHSRCEGGYAVVAMINGYGIVGFRDPHGVRPLVYGKREAESGTEYMIASESVALDALGFQMIADVAPGEAVYVDADNQLHVQQCAEKTMLAPCLFEYVYFARPDSKIDGVSVYQSRLSMGSKLADKLSREWPEHDIDVVMPIPDTSRTSALELATRLGISYREGFVKNRYIGRTFIMPGQTLRKKSVRQKLNAIEEEFRGKNVLLVDDSIVRGTTSNQIVEMAREAGANKVYFCSAAPAVRYPNVYGIDMPVASELVAHGRTTEEVCELIEADKLIYQDLDDLKAAVAEHNPAISHFDSSVFDGEYITGNIDRAYLDQVANARNDLSRQQQNEDSENIDLHNEPTDN